MLDLPLFVEAPNEQAVCPHTTIVKKKNYNIIQYPVRFCIVELITHHGKTMGAAIWI
jgi:hypothetical protein